MNEVAVKPDILQKPGYGRTGHYPIIGAILLFAAAMKAWQLATVPGLGGGLISSRWFGFCVVEFELAFGIWLFFGLLPQWTRMATIGLFSFFGAISLYKALSGETSCGCFGSLQVNPWITFVLDALVAAVVFFRRNGPAHGGGVSINKIAVMAILWLMPTAVTLYALGSVDESKRSELGTEFVGVNGHRSILLEPEKWQGREFPLLPFIEPTEVREQLMSGEWTVVLYRSDCQKCQKVITDLVKKGTSRGILIEIPPCGTESVIPEGFLHARLNEKMIWFAETPYVFSWPK